MKKLILCAMAFTLAAALLSACSGGKKGTVYPVELDGASIVVNETTLGDLIDAGFDLYIMDGRERTTLDPDLALEGNSAYTSVFVGKDGENAMASLSIIAEKDCTVRDGLIYHITVMESGVSHASLNGTALTELTPEKAKEIEPNLEDNDLYQSFVTKNTILRIYRTDGVSGDVEKLEMEYRYNINYSSK